MRIMLSALAAATILGAANLAYAADATGTIKSIDMSKHTVTLDNGSTYDVAKNSQVQWHEDRREGHADLSAVRKGDGRHGNQVSRLMSRSAGRSP